MTDDSLYGREANRLEVLLDGRNKPTVTRPGDKLEVALELMFEHDYSQLPVVDDKHHPVGLLTQNGVLRTLSHLNVLAGPLSVRDAMIDRRPEYVATIDAHIWSVLDRFERIPALMVVDSADRLVGIITDHDTTAYLRQRSEDLLAVQDIEETLKQLIRDAYARDSSADLAAEIGRMIRDQWEGDVRGPVFKALSLYDKAANGKRCKDVFDTIATELSPGSRPFERLSFAQYKRLLLSGASWERYEQHVALDRSRFDTLLTQIGDTRNALAHLRGGLDRKTRDRLMWFKEWLDRTLFPLVSEPMPAEPEDEAETGASERQTADELPSHEDGNSNRELSARDEDDGGDEPNETSPDVAYLAPLKALLDRKRARKVELTFAEIEEHLDGGLPEEARNHRSWWSNLAPHADAWLDAGYSVAGAFTAAERVRFLRDEVRGRKYLEFFQELAQGVKDRGEHSFEPKAGNWIRLGWAHTADREGLSLVASFMKTRQFQLRLLIDVKDSQRNRAIFERLQEMQPHLEERLGTELTWLPRKDKRACIVALVAPGKHHVDDAPEAHQELLRWAVTNTPMFMRVMRDAVGGLTSEGVVEADPPR